MEFQIITLVIVLGFLFQDSQATFLRLDHPDGGEFTSPGYPATYPENNSTGFYIKARRNQVIQVTFLDFQLEDVTRGIKTDYIKLKEGRLVENTKPIFLYGKISTPFVYLSTTNRLRILMITNGRTEDKGFRARYKFMNAKLTCDAFKLHSNHSILQSCTSVANSPSSQCVVQCKQKHQLVGTNISNCVNGSFTEVQCLLLDDVVSQCEDTELKKCPYTLEALLDYLLHHRLRQPGNMTEAELLEEEMRFEQIANEIVRGVNLCRTFCARQKSKPHPYLLPKMCGRLHRRRQRLQCMRCRYYPNNCAARKFL